MPFTHIGESQLRLLTGAFGTLTIHSPADELVPEHMRDWQSRKLLNIRHPQSVDWARLECAIQDYKSWADLHKGDIAEMAGFFKYSQERFAMMDETNPTQISHQIRHYDAPQQGDSADPLIQAALLLSLAQEFDEQHQTMDRQMNTVESMEKQMMEQLAGGSVVDDDDLPMLHTRPPSSHDQNMDPQMLSLRVRAWSLVARDNTVTPGMYLTTSQAALDHIIQKFPEAQEVYSRGLFTPEGEPTVPVANMQELIETLMGEPDTQLPDEQAHPDASLKNRGHILTIYRLGGVSSQGFLTTLGDTDREAKTADQHSGSTPDTLVGLVAPEG